MVSYNTFLLHITAYFVSYNYSVDTQHRFILIVPYMDATFFFTAVPYILILSKSFIYQLMHNRVALKEY